MFGTSRMVQQSMKHGSLSAWASASIGTAFYQNYTTTAKVTPTGTILGPLGKEGAGKQDKQILIESLS